jgi:hypothetical protein
MRQLLPRKATLAAGTATRAAKATPGIMETPEIVGMLGTKGMRAAMVLQETAEPQEVPGIPETATQVERATEMAETVATPMRDKAILTAGEAHQVREAPRTPESHQAEEPLPARAMQPTTKEERRRPRKLAMLPGSVGQHPL